MSIRSLTNAIFLILLLITTTHTISQPNIDPLSKINIKSNSAVLQKDEKKQKTYLFTYKENVLVTFADESTIDSDELEIELDSNNLNELTTTDSSKSEHQKQNPSSIIKKIKFKNNVKVKSQNKKINANYALVDVNQKICYLYGNVFIEQIKENKKDLPITTKCDKSTLNFKTGKVTFIGSKQNPVNTVIEIEKSLLKKKSETPSRHHNGSSGRSEI